jgi:hypothetical protein
MWSGRFDESLNTPIVLYGFYEGRVIQLCLIGICFCPERQSIVEHARFATVARNPTGICSSRVSSS